MQGRILIQKSNTYFHIYQKTVDGFLLFYTVKDYLVFFMIICLAARRYGIQVVGICLMPDHLHILIKAVSKRKLTAFVSAYSKQFSRINNEWYGRVGAVFYHHYGYASKTGDKAIRTAIAYLYNNPVEKWLCKKAREYQWNFLAYGNDPHPFSEEIVFRTSRSVFREAIRTVKFQHNRSSIVSYEQLDNLVKNLNTKEIKYLTDYIIKTYNCIDYAELQSHYNSYDRMLDAFATVTVKEYDLNEDFTPGSDRAYMKIYNSIKRIAPGKDLREILSLPEEERRLLQLKILRMKISTERQSAKFLRLRSTVIN